MRLLKNEEIDLITHMLNHVPNGDYFSRELPHLKVEEMNDGGMGSLRFYPEKADIIYKDEIARINLRDIDDVALSITINIGTDGELYELDIFKGDFSPLKQFPLPPYNSDPGDNPSS